MRILRDPAHAGPCVIVLGMFDGVHRGHQTLLMKGRSLADQYGVPLYVLTFEPHPLRTVRPELAPPMLTTLPERAALFADYGVDALCVLPFTPSRAAQAPEEFLAAMKRQYSPKAVVCGFNFTFGDRGRGNTAMLADWAVQNGIETAVMEDFRIAGETVSSTRIRGLLAEGDVTTAARLLGHFYTLGGPVVHGRRIGRFLGYPTANIRPPQDKALPANGVYIATLETKDIVYPAMVDIGSHPTLPDGRMTVEAHIPGGVEVDLYGQRVRLRFLARLRDEKRFEGREELIAQLREDADSTLAFFAALSEND